MFTPNLERVLAQIQPKDVVLDIGGWAQPFQRANYVIDALPYETRGTWYAGLGRPAHIGQEPECFTQDTWIQRDVCARAPFPFKDKSIDYVICSQTLEDIRDPLWVCSEIIRVGKRGYLEVPSRLYESIWDPWHRIAGAVHHRWLVTVENNRLIFEMKYHFIHKQGHHLKDYVNGLLRPEERVAYLFWEGAFEFEEAPIALGEDVVRQRLQAFVQAHQRPAPWGYRVLWSLYKRWPSMKDRVPSSMVRLIKNLSNGSGSRAPDCPPRR